MSGQNSKPPVFFTYNKQNKIIVPLARELDKKEEFSYNTLQKMAELGLFGVFVSEES